MIQITDKYAIDTDGLNFTVLTRGWNKDKNEWGNWRQDAHYPLVVSGGFECGLTHAKMYILKKETFADFSGVDRVIAKVDEVFQAIKAQDEALHDEVSRKMAGKQ